MKRHISHLERERKAESAAKAERERALVQMQAERRNLTELLETRTAELKEAQTYLSKVDDVSDSDVLALVERINTQIFQTAAKIADDFQPRYGTQADCAVVEEAVARLEKAGTVNAQLPRILCTNDHRADPILVQITLQDALATISYHSASPWSPSLDKHTTFLRDIYDEMCKHEPQSVFGRWRTMTLGYMRPIISERAWSASTPAARMLGSVCDALLACGVDGTSDQLCDLLKEQYGKRLKQLATHVLEFRRIAGETVISRDLRVMVATSRTPFISAWMEDEWADGKNAAAAASSGGTVLCTTHLGLVRDERVAVEAGKSPEEATRNVVLVKPKVVLQNTLQELLAEAPPETERERESIFLIAYLGNQVLTACCAASANSLEQR
ncbi:hypothetical protein C2E23DRAFT_740990 [Lenzites betulinus]|nr:hypothetical protein C2E23DRAFT_740990 [Lenzites betulinus]